jgi:hypothetical protein
VLVSFIISAVTVYLTIFYGYFMDLLPGPPGNYLTAADRGFLMRWGLCADCGRRRTKASKNVTSACIHTSPKIDAQCREGLLRFLLSLSDQQLVIALAMTIAALNQHCDISVYEFNVVTSLVYLALLTHIATLIVLRHYFREKKLSEMLEPARWSLIWPFYYSLRWKVQQRRG